LLKDKNLAKKKNSFCEKIKVWLIIYKGFTKKDKSFTKKYKSFVKKKEIQ
jgi:hypothetical protein